MNRTSSVFRTLVALSIGAAGCAIQHSADTMAPSSVSSSTPWFVGTWKSSVVSAPTGATCGNFEWRVTNQADGIISGIFFAQCGGRVAGAGLAWGDAPGG